MVRRIEGPIHLYFINPLEFRFITRANGEVVCLVPYLELEVGGDSLESVMNRTVRTIRALANMFRCTPTHLLSSRELVEKELYLDAVDLARTFNLGASLH